MNIKLMKAGCALVVALALVPGCKSKQEQALDLAKKQAAATGQPQQVVSVDKNGTTTTTIVQPPVPGQAGQQITTTTTPGAAPVTPGNPQVTPAGAPGTAFTSNPTANPAPANGPDSGAASAPAPMPAQPVPGGAPVVRPADVNIPAGTTLVIRINQHISVKTTPAGSHFDGELADSYADANGRVILPRGTHVEGRVDESHRRGHFKGESVLELRLTSLSLNGQRYPLATHDVVRTKKGKGKRSAAFIGGGSGLGALIGGLAGGGKGALIGGLAGGGAGTLGAGLTGNRDLDIPAESVIRFRLADDLTLEG